MITAGIDCGAGKTKAVMLKQGTVVAAAKGPTGFDREQAGSRALEEVLQGGGLSLQELQGVGLTGSGRASMGMAGMAVDEMEAMAAAAGFFFPGACTVADVGAEEGRVARIDEKGRVADTAVNERCAAGAGMFIETMARALEVELDRMGPLCLRSGREVPVNAQCVVFAESEVVGLIHAGTPKEDISRAIHEAVAARIVSLIRRVGVKERLVMIGGVARNPGIVEAVKRELRLETVFVPRDPEFGAALGAALAARRRREEERISK